MSWESIKPNLWDHWTHFDDCRVTILILALATWTKLLLFAFNLVGVARENHRVAVAGRWRDFFSVMEFFEFFYAQYYENPDNSPFRQRVDIRYHQNPIVVLLCVIHHRVDARADALAPDIVITLCLQQKQKSMKIRKFLMLNLSSQLTSDAAANMQTVIMKVPSSRWRILWFD